MNSYQNQRTTPAFNLRHIHTGVALGLSALGLSVMLMWNTAQGSEQRCAELGAACACSEPMTGAITGVGSKIFNIASGSAKQCSGRDGTFGGGNLANSVTRSSDPTFLSTFPTGHTVPAVVSIQGITDGFMGGRVDPVQGRGTIAMRWYNYKHTDYNCGSNTCKIAMLWTNSTVQWSLINHNYWKLPLAGGDQNVIGRFTVGRLGAWHRYEMVLENGTGPNAKATLYEKNVTDNTPERVLVQAPGSGWTDSVNQNLVHTFGTGALSFSNLPTILTLNVNREGADGGREAWSHFMIAQWPITGQRVGAAYEIETGAPSPGPVPSALPQTPATPTVQKQ